MTVTEPELLAPAGGPPQLEAALHAGADAVYFGLRDGFHARARATGFTPDALEQVMRTLHAAGRRGYLAFNTLLFDEELETAERQLRHAAECGVDALIVQDPGLARLAREVVPGLPLHASTQMSITDAEGVAFAASLGMRRVVLGRELSIEDIAAIAGETDVELEVFVHGALCVSYSGQCFSSEAWGGRSANRGQCAQSCRLPYGLIVDGRLRETGGFDHLLSPQDLMALPLLPALLRAGVDSLKIEGRLKGPVYVLETVRAYRAALDELLEHGSAAERIEVPVAQRRRLAQVFSRGQDARNDGLTPGFLEGPRHQRLVIGRNPRHRGLYLGEVEAVTGDGVRVRLHNPVQTGDGVVFDTGRQSEEIGGTVWRVEREGRPVEGPIEQGEVLLRFSRALPLHRIAVGAGIWRTRERDADRAPRLRPVDAWKRPLKVRVSGRLGEPLRIRLELADGRHAEAVGTRPLATATHRPLDADAVWKAVGELGDSPFRIVDRHCALPRDAFLPLGEIKQVRRQAVTALRRLIETEPPRCVPAAQPVLPRLLPRSDAPAPPRRAELALLCRTLAQAEAAVRLDGIDEIQLDFLEVHGLKDACRRVRDAGRRLVVAAPRILRPGEERLVRYLLRLEPDALLVRSTGLLQRLLRAGGTGAAFDADTVIPPLYGDFSLNAANRLAAALLLERGLARLTPTHDLDARQLAALARGLPPDQRERIEVVAHQHLPIFHTEHCVFARFLSDGENYRDCGRPCERHRVHLRDPRGQDHLLAADVGCRNTLFNARAQTAARRIDRLLKAGIGRFRIELVDEPADQVAPLVDGYRALLDGRIDAAHLLRRLATVPDANGVAQGIDEGSLAVRVEPPRRTLKRPTAR